MADQPIPLRRYLAANAVALAPSAVAIAALYGSGFLAGRPALIAMAGIAAVTGFLVQRYLGSLARCARFVGELSGEREPVKTAQAFEFFRGDRAEGFGRQEVADASDGTKGDRTAASYLARRRPCGRRMENPPMS